MRGRVVARAAAAATTAGATLPGRHSQGDTPGETLPGTHCRGDTPGAAPRHAASSRRARHVGHAGHAGRARRARERRSSDAMCRRGQPIVVGS